MKKLALLALSLVPIAASAATAPKVVFFGDGYTAAWPLPAGYINSGVAGYNLGGLTSSAAAADFQSAVVSQHPAIVHIMVGGNDQTGDASYPYVIPGYLDNINTMVTEAKAANIQVILGNITPNFGGWGLPINILNVALAEYGAANGIQVINYHDALCQCVGSTVGQFDNITTATQYLALGGDGPLTPGLEPNAAGYALMTQMAQTAIANLTVTLKGGYLQNIVLPTPGVYEVPKNQNTVQPGQILQFTPVGLYSDGTTRSQTNSGPTGASGAWTSSDPTVMYVSQTGQAWAFKPGTAIIKYTPASGVHFSEWIMYIVGPS